MYKYNSVEEIRVENMEELLAMDKFRLAHTEDKRKTFCDFVGYPTRYEFPIVVYCKPDHWEWNKGESLDGSEKSVEEFMDHTKHFNTELSEIRIIPSDVVEEPTLKFNIGDDVLLNKECAWYGKSNQLVGIGTIVEILPKPKEEEYFPYKVKLSAESDREYNNYREKDLVLYEDTAKVVQKAIKSNGGSSTYYDIVLTDRMVADIVARHKEGEAYIKTEEVLECCGSDFDVCNIIKCSVRISSLMNGVGKEGNDVLYDASKIQYSANRLKARFGV